LGKQEWQHGGKGTDSALRELRAAGEEVYFLVSKEQRKNAETFCEGHADDGLDQDLTGRAGITTDRFRGFLTDQTDAESGTEKTESAGDIARDFSEDYVVHSVVDLLVAVAAVRTRSTLPAIKDQWWALAE
jgi:hypothetical protein